MKNKSKKLIALLSVCCLATATAALAACDKEEAATPADGKSAYQIAVDNGFEGTEKEWLETLIGEQGAPAVDHVHAYGEVVTLATPQLEKNGFGYKTCTVDGCGHSELVVLEKPVVTVDEATEVVNDGVVYVEIPAMEESGRLRFEVTDEENYAVDADIAYYKHNGTFFEEIDLYDTRFFMADERVVAALLVDPSYATFKVTPKVSDPYELYANKITVNKAGDGTFGGATAVQAIEDTPMGVFPASDPAPIDPATGEATLELTPSANGVKLQLVGLEDNYIIANVDADGNIENEGDIWTSLPSDGSHDEGGEYTIDILREYTWNFTAVAKDASPLADANITVYKGKTYNETTEKVTVWEVEEVLTANTDGQTSFSVYDNTTIGGTSKGCYYQATITSDVGDSYWAIPVVLDGEHEDVTLTVDGGVSELTVGAAPIAAKFSPYVSSANMYAKVTTEADKTYKVTLNNATVGTSYALHEDEKDAVYGTRDSETNKVTFIVSGLEAGEHAWRISAGSEMSTDMTIEIAEILPPDVIVAELGEVISVETDMEYKFAVPEAGTYKLTFVKVGYVGQAGDFAALSQLCVYKTEDDSTADMGTYANVWIDGWSEQTDGSYECAADTNFTFYINQMTGADLQVKIEKV